MKQIGIDLELMDNNQEELTINLYGQADDEVNLITKSIIELISHIDLQTCDDDQMKFDQEMAKIFFALAENYNKNGISMRVT